MKVDLKEMRKNIGGLRGEMHKEIGGLRDKMRREFGELGKA